MMENEKNNAALDRLKKLVLKKRKTGQGEVKVAITPKDIFKEKIASPDYQTKISSIIYSYGLEDPEYISVDNKYIDRSEGNNKFFVNINYNFESLNRDFYKKNKPQFVIFVSAKSDDCGSLGNVYIPVDDEIRLVNYDYLFAFGGIGAGDKIEGLGYELLNPQDHDFEKIWNSPLTPKYWFNSVSNPVRSQIFIYGQKDTDISLLKTHIGKNWEF